MQLRDYQKAAVAAAEWELQMNDSTLLVMATGLGKTICFTSLLDNWSQGRTLVIAPMINLVWQAAEKIRDATGIDPAIEQGTNWSNESAWGKCPFVVASKDSLLSKWAGHKGQRRYERFSDVGLVVVDEAHLSITKLYSEMLQWFKDRGAKVLGVTATPKRHDKRAMEQMYSSVAFQYNILEALDDGWLAPCKAECVRLKSLELGDVETVRGFWGADFKQEALQAKLEDDATIYEIAEVTARETAGMKTVIYCASVDEARGVAERLSDVHGVKAGWICSDTKRQPEVLRHDNMQNFNNGVITHMANVGILTTGWDSPSLQAIVQARPTKSLPLFTQIFGRATRPLPGVVDGLATKEERKAAIAASAKPHFYMLDLVDNSMNHKIRTVHDVLAGAWTLGPDRHSDVDSDPSVEKAKKEAMEKGGKGDPMEFIDTVRKRMEMDRARLERAAMPVNVTYGKHAVNPHSGGGAGKVQVRVARMPFGKHKGKKLTDVSTGYLSWLTQQKTSKWLLEAARKEIAWRRR